MTDNNLFNKKMNTKIVIGIGAVIILIITGVAVKVFYLDTRDVIVQDDGSMVQMGDGSFRASGENGSVDISADGSMRASGENGSMEATEGAQKNIVLVFDDSGSMTETISGQSRINIAKTAASKFIAGLTEDVNLSIVVYGHKGNNTQAQKAVSCQGIEEVYYMGKVNDSVAQSKVNKLVPTGWTPIANSLTKAKEILLRSGGKDNSVILLSDGEETCGGDPIAVAKDLCQSGIKTNVIGLGVAGATEAQLSNIAVSGCGTYYSAGDTTAIQNAFIKVGGGSLDITTFNAGVNITGSGEMHLQGDNGTVDVSGNNVDLQAADGRSIKTNPDGTLNLDNGQGTSVDVPNGYGY